MMGDFFIRGVQETETFFMGLSGAREEAGDFESRGGLTNANASHGFFGTREMVGSGLPGGDGCTHTGRRGKIQKDTLCIPIPNHDL